jgi:hypothetical protein
MVKRPTGSILSGGKVLMIVVVGDLGFWWLQLMIAAVDGSMRSGR